MNFFLAFLTLAGVAIGIANAQQGEKGNSIIPFPRVGRSGNSPGLIPFPRIGRDGGFQKRQLIPFPRVGKRAFWHLPIESAYYTEYEDFNPMLVDPSMGATNFLPASPPFQMEAPSESDGDVDKRSGNSGTASGGMWFGPRLGRKKRDTSSVSAVDASTTIDMKPLLKMLHNSEAFIIVPIKERRNFTPRLGRKRAQPFSPRLGRSGELSLSSMGVEDEQEEVETRTHFQTRTPNHHDTTPDPVFDRSGPPFNPRLGRSDPFSPRLGRGDPFSPRLGRSSSSANSASSSQQSDDRD